MWEKNKYSKYHIIKLKKKGLNRNIIAIPKLGINNQSNEINFNKLEQKQIQ